VHGELAQLIALAAHGSAWLAGRTGALPPDLEGTNSTFRFVRQVRFELEGSLLHKPVIATDVASWLEDVRHRGLTRLWLAIPDGAGVSDRRLIAFVGTATWFLIATEKDRPAEVWRPIWTLAEGDAPDRPMWDVEYRGRRMSKVEVPHLSPAVSMERLTGAITAAEAFAASEGLDDWAAVFGAALRLGEAADAVPPFHPDMFPPAAYGRAARHLLAMADRAFVFGGMGSWNDLALASPSATDAYERVSAELYAAVLEAVVAAVNGSIER
jgi:hypothetical protein